MYSAALTRIYSYSWRASGFPGSALSGTVVMRVRNPSRQQTAAANRAAVQRGRVCRATMAGFLRVFAAKGSDFRLSLQVEYIRHQRLLFSSGVAKIGIGKLRA